MCTANSWGARLILILLPLIALASAAFSQTTILDIDSNENCLAIKISLLNKERKILGAKIKLYENNTLDSEIENSVLVEKIILKRERHYTVEVNKEGFYPRLISISTVIPKALKVKDDFLFEYAIDLELIPVSKEKIDSYYMDFPIALISYDEKKKRFFYREKYTNHIKDSIEKEVGIEFSGK
ncbi:MAG: hypothetical protein J0M08_10040 [Bacteroidetes bacterium]|nr:hypothetical protein [Bacteroidota bacterium]